MRTFTSPAFGGSIWTSSMLRGVWYSFRMAAFTGVPPWEVLQASLERAVRAGYHCRRRSLVELGQRLEPELLWRERHGLRQSDLLQHRAEQPDALALAPEQLAVDQLELLRQHVVQRVEAINIPAPPFEADDEE